MRSKLTWPSWSRSRCLNAWFKSNLSLAFSFYNHFEYSLIRMILLMWMVFTSCSLGTLADGSLIGDQRPLFGFIVRLVSTREAILSITVWLEKQQYWILRISQVLCSRSYTTWWSLDCSISSTIVSSTSWCKHLWSFSLNVELRLSIRFPTKISWLISLVLTSNLQCSHLYLFGLTTSVASRL